MSNSSEIRVLATFDPYLRLLTAFNGSQFRHNNWRDILRSVLYAFATTFVLISMLMWIILIAWNLLENDFEWIKCVVIVPIIVRMLEIVLTFVVMITKNSTLIGTIDQLQRAVDLRKSFFFLTFQFYCLLAKQSTILHLIGCTGSERQHRIYADAENKHASVTTMLTIICIATGVCFCALPLMFPILYAIFHYPPPEDWRLPVETQ